MNNFLEFLFGVCSNTVSDLNQNLVYKDFCVATRENCGMHDVVSDMSVTSWEMYIIMYYSNNGIIADELLKSNTKHIIGFMLFGSQSLFDVMKTK